MKASRFIILTIGTVICALCWECNSLRCRSDDGPSEEEIKKIVRVCMRKVGENDTNNDYNDDDYSAEDSEDDDTRYNQNQNRRNQSNRFYSNNNNGYNYQNNYQGGYQNDPYGNSGGNNQFPRDRNPIGGNGMYNNWNNQPNYNAFGDRNSNGNGNSNGRFDQNYGYNSNAGGNRMNNNNSNNNQTEHDRACVMHCFFHELRMTNNEDFPDKRKMMHVLAQDIRDRELKDFYIDSIQQCFYLVDHMDNYNQQKDKCTVAQTIVTCLTERAKTNCEDYHEDVMIF